MQSNVFSKETAHSLVSAITRTNDRIYAVGHCIRSARRLSNISMRCHFVLCSAFCTCVISSAHVCCCACMCACTCALCAFFLCKFARTNARWTPYHHPIDRSTSFILPDLASLVTLRRCPARGPQGEFERRRSVILPYV